MTDTNSVALESPEVTPPVSSNLHELPRASDACAEQSSMEDVFGVFSNQVRKSLQAGLETIKQPIYSERKVAELFDYVDAPPDVAASPVLLSRHFQETVLVANVIKTGAAFATVRTFRLIQQLTEDLAHRTFWQRLLRRPSTHFAVVRRLPLSNRKGSGGSSRYITLSNFTVKLTMGYDPDSLAQKFTIEALYGVG